MLKRRLTAAQFAELDSALQALYKKAEGSDNYMLEVEADAGDGAAELKKAKDREKKRADQEKARADAAEARAKELEDEQEAAREQAGKGLDEAGVKKLKDKHALELKQRDDMIAAKDGQLAEVLVDSAAAALAADIFIAPELHTHLVKSRMKLVDVDGKPVVKVLDAEGNIMEDKKIEDLRAEFVADTKFAPIVVASKASGGGASGGSKGGGAPKKKLSEMTATEEAQFANENPDAYAQMVAAESGGA